MRTLIPSNVMRYLLNLKYGDNPEKLTEALTYFEITQKTWRFESELYLNDIPEETKIKNGWIEKTKEPHTGY